MKPLGFFILLLAVITLISCNSKDENRTEDNNTEVPVKTVPKDSIKIWQFDTSLDAPVAAGVKYFDNLTPEKITAYASTDKVKLDFIKISHDTIFVRIKDSDYLSQRMGTTGARAFLSVATYTLTELKGIKYVNFDFIEGDHAVPGTYNRGEFVPVE